MFSFLINPFFIFWFPVFVCLSIFVSFFSGSFAFVRFNKNQPYILLDVFFHHSLRILGVSCFCFQSPFPLFCLVFLIWRFIFCNIIHCSSFTKMQVKNLHILVKRGVATYGFFIHPCFATCHKLSFFLSFFFFRNFWLVCTNQKNIENTCFPPPPPNKKRILFNFSVSPFVFLGSSSFSLSFCVSHPISEFSTSKSDVPCFFFFFPRLLHFPSIFFFFLVPFFFPLLQSLFFLFVHVMLALLVPFYVSPDVFFCSCFCFSPSSLVNYLLQLTSVFLLFGLVLPLFLSRLPCSSLLSCSSFASFPSVASFFYFLLFLFFSLLLLLLCFEEQKKKRTVFLAALVCVRFSFCFGSSVENGPIPKKRQKLYTIFWHFFIQDTFLKKPSTPRVWGFLSAVLLHKRVFLRFVLEPAKRKCTRETLQK